MLCCASCRNFPPPNPERPNVTPPLSLAYAIARKTFSELPLPEMPITKSPTLRKFELHYKNILIGQVIGIGGDEPHVVSKAMSTELDAGRQKYAFVPIRHKVRSSQCAPTVTADNNLFSRFPRVANELNSGIDFSNIDPMIGPRGGRDNP